MRKSVCLSAITPKRYEIWCQLVLITNRKSHTGFRLIPTSMTLSGVIALILCCFFHRIRLLCWPITSQWLTYNVRKILSPSSSLPLLAITHRAARSLCDSWTTCYFNRSVLPARVSSALAYKSLNAILVSLRNVVSWWWKPELNSHYALPRACTLPFAIKWWRLGVHGLVGRNRHSIGNADHM